MLSHSLNTVGLYIKQVLEGSQETLGIQDVYYGDVPLKPNFPAVSVQPLRLTREIKGTHKFQVMMEFELVLTVFKMGDPNGREETINELIESITNVFDSDRTLNNLVIFSMVAEVDMVDVALGSVMIRGATMTIQSLSEELF